MSELKEEDLLQEFTRIVSHDLGGALRGVNQLTAMLEHDISDRLTEKERYWMGLIKLSAERSQALITALTDYNRLAYADRQQSVNLADLIQSCIAGSVSSEDDVTISVAVEDIQVTGAVSHWQILIQALLDNALRFCNRTDQGEIKVQLSVKDSCGYLVIEDNGPGIKLQDRANLLGLFKTTAEQTELEHLGVGLSYCARIAMLNAATLQLEDADLGGLKVIYRFSI